MSKPASWVKDARKRTQNKGIEKGFQRRRVEQSGLDHIWTADLGGPYFTSNQSKATTEKRDVDETIANKLITLLNIDANIGQSYETARAAIRQLLNNTYQSNYETTKSEILNSVSDEVEIVPVFNNLFESVKQKTKPALLERMAQTVAKYLFPGIDTRRRQITKTNLQRNNNYNYVLYVLDIFSRFLWTRPLKTTKPDEVKSAFADILEKAAPRRPRAYVWTDEGAEFENFIDAMPIEPELQNRRGNQPDAIDADDNPQLTFETRYSETPSLYDFTEGRNHMNKKAPFIQQVEQYHTHSKNKASMAERVIKTIQDMMNILNEVLQPTYPNVFNLKLQSNGITREAIRAYEQEIIDERLSPFYSDWTLVKDMTMLEYATHRYNNNFHRSLHIQHGDRKPTKHTPTTASNPENENELLKAFYDNKHIPIEKIPYDIGDTVRVVVEDKIKKKGQLVWSDDKYKVAKIKPTQPTTYKVKPLDGGNLLKRSFYSQEMWKV